MRNADTQKGHAHRRVRELGRRAQIAGSPLHAAQSAAAGTNQRNPPADRYGSLTATPSSLSHTRARARIAQKRAGTLAVTTPRLRHVRTFRQTNCFFYNRSRNP